MNNALVQIITVMGGICSGMQGPINSSLGKKVGVFEAALFSFGVGTIILLGIVFLTGKGSFRSLADTHPWQWIGGGLGIIYIAVNIIAIPRLGSTTSAVCAIAGQLLIGVIIDHFGFLCITKNHPISTTRISGILLMVLSIYLIKK